MITLTRIFLLTQGHQTLVREITTPSLPTFIKSALNAVYSRSSPQDERKVNPASPVLEPVLQSFTELLPYHPSLFRPFVAQIRSSMLSLIAPTPSNIPPQKRVEASLSASSGPSISVTAVSQTLFALLPQCEPKKSSMEEWNREVSSVINLIHRTADFVFRAVLEDSPSPGLRNSVVDPRTFGEIVADTDRSKLDLPGWRGIYAGAERLIGLLHTLQAFIATPTSSSIALPSGAIHGVTVRILSVCFPQHSKQSGQSGARINPEIGRDEREGLWASLPQIHVSTLEIMSIMVSRIKQASIPLASGFMDQLLWVFQNESENRPVRGAVYNTLFNVLEFSGPSISQSSINEMSFLIQACCHDVLPRSKQQLHTPKASLPGPNKSLSNGASAEDADSYLRTPSTAREMSKEPTYLRSAATALLSQIMRRLPVMFIADNIRTQIDRTAILTQNKSVLLASTLEPSSRDTVSSLIPFLARAYPDTTEVETILRPRMPALQLQHSQLGDPDLQEETHGTFEELHRDFRGNGNHQSTENETTVNEPKIASFLGDSVPDSSNKSQPKTRVSMQSPPAADVAASQDLTFPESRKRARDMDESNDNTPPPITTTAGILDTLPPPEPAVKRVRLGSQELVMPDTPTPGIPATENIPSTHPVESAPGPSATKSSPSPERISSISKPNINNDSDESDFEIPPIIVGDDTDEDEEDATDNVSDVLP